MAIDGTGTRIISNISLALSPLCNELVTSCVKRARFSKVSKTNDATKGTTTLDSLERTRASLYLQSLSDTVEHIR